jgi:predicted Zn-dependent protease
VTLSPVHWPRPVHSRRSLIFLQVATTHPTAESALKDLLRQYPNASSVWEQLGGLYYDQGKMPDAGHHFSEAFFRNPTNKVRAA